MRLFGILAAAALACTLAGCAAPQQQQPDHSQLKVNDAGVSSDEGSQGGEEATVSAEEAKPTASELRAKLISRKTIVPISTMAKREPAIRSTLCCTTPK